MLELKETSDEYVIIEAIPRFWGPLQFVVDNGVPIITQFLVECGFPLEQLSRHAAEDPSPNSEFYFWSRGLTRSAQPLILQHYSEKCFLADYPRLIRHDVYLRDDTISPYAAAIREQT